jgi:hypothetical protein
MFRMQCPRWAVALLTVWLPLAGAACGKEAGEPGTRDASADGTTPIEDAGAPDGVTAPSDGSILIAPDGCTPVTACPATVGCGRYKDPCSGAIFACGAACPSGQACTADPNDPTSQSCKPKTCPTGTCGVVGLDSCGVAIACGGCPTGEDCVANQCVVADGGLPDASAMDACAPLTCTPNAQTALCGTVSDGCGHTMGCTCPAGKSCIGGVCGDTPPECTPADAGAALCGTTANACGSGNVSCPSTCTGTQECVKGVCTACTPPSCGRATCGSMNNGCGPALSCGTCSTNEVCDDGGCCTQQTSCAELLDAGLVTGCNPVDLGCGVKKACMTCPSGEICTNDQCVACVSKTCADFGNAGCGHSDGCGHTLNCCAAGLACTGGLCCRAGEVAYNGSCCAPACDPSQPPGSQVSCGQVLFCSGGGGGGPR